MKGPHFSSERQNWKTPKAFFQALDAEFGFNFDPCPAKPDFNGLEVDWKERNFVNPPYKELRRWAHKSYMEAKRGKLVVMLIPSRTDTQWWHDFIMKADEIRFIKGRLNFDGHKNSAPFRWKTTERHDAQRFAGQRKVGFPARRAAP